MSKRGNPYHDKRGRFSSRGNAGTGTVLTTVRQPDGTGRMALRQNGKTTVVGTDDTLAPDPHPLLGGLAPDPHPLLGGPVDPNFVPPPSIAAHQARLVPGSDRSNSVVAPSKTTQARIDALTEDIRLHGDAGRRGGGEKAQRVRYLKKQLVEQKASEEYVRRSWGPAKSGSDVAAQAARGRAAQIAKLRKTVSDHPGSMAARMAQEKLDRIKG